MKTSSIIPLLIRLAPVVVALVLLGCREVPPEPLVDMPPVGDALRFLGIALVLGAVIRCVACLWDKDKR